MNMGITLVDLAWNKSEMKFYWNIMMMYSLTTLMGEQAPAMAILFYDEMHFVSCGKKNKKYNKSKLSFYVWSQLQK